MKKLYVSDFQVVPSAVNCCADALTKALEQCGDNCEVIFPAGVYFLTKRVIVSHHKNLTISGENATIRVHYCNSDRTGLDGAFRFEDCKNLVLRKLHFDTDVPPNISGRISAINQEEGYFDLRIFDEFKLNGNETLEAFDSMDEDLTPNYLLATYEESRHTYLGNNTFRFYADGQTINLDRLYEGLLLNIRHSRYGATLNTFAFVDTCLIEDVTITAAPGCTMIISPRCRNFTLRRYRIQLPEGSRRLMASNADGVHANGLTGKLEMKDCYFEALGDDALNIHGKACMVSSVDSENNTMEFHAVGTVRISDPASHMKASSGRPDIQLVKSAMGPEWSAPGDRIYVYDTASLLKVGEIRVVSVQGTLMKYEVLSGSVSEGNTLANAEYYASVHLDGCTVRNTRARGFLLQTDNVLIENCHIYGMAMSAFLISPDTTYWFEVGPCTNVEIRNNLIEKCASCIHRSNTGAIIIKCRHEEGVTDSPAGVHNHISIHGNTFRNIGDSAVFALAVRDLKIKDNRFENCCCLPFDETVESLKYDVALVNCDDVEIAGNISTQSSEFALHRVNVTNLH